MNQAVAPFWDALVAYEQAGVVPFHTPGHKLLAGPFSNIEAALGPGFFALDPSDEIENIDLNHDFERVLKEAEQLAAELFGALDSLFLVNGTTGGLHYLLMPATGSVLVPRFSHQAIYSALVLSGGQAVYLPASYDADWFIPLPPSIPQVETCLTETKTEALVLTNPTYYGTVSSLEKIVDVAQKRDVRVFVDEAHGGHFQFSSELPATALECGADAVVQSTHKTLGSFTQTSMLHSNNTFWFSKVVQAKQVLQTTSPSMVFLAVLDEVRRVLAKQGPQLVSRALEMAINCAKQLSEIDGVDVLPRDLQSDPTKIVFSLHKLGLTGIEVERILRVDYNIQVELSDYYSVLALISLGDTSESIDKLVAAVYGVTKRCGHLSSKPLPLHKLDVPALPHIMCTLREGFFAEKETVSLHKAAGRISGSFLTPYPPGVPVIVPGEQFTEDIVEYLRWCLAISWPVRGLMPEQNVVVLKDNS